VLIACDSITWQAEAFTTVKNVDRYSAPVYKADTDASRRHCVDKAWLYIRLVQNRHYFPQEDEDTGFLVGFTC